MRTKYSFAESDLSHFYNAAAGEWGDLFSREKYRGVLIENSKYCIKIKERFQSAQEELAAMATCPENIGDR